MKKIMILLCALLVGSISYAQTFTGKSTPSNAITSTAGYGHQPINYTTGQVCNITQGTVTPVASGKLDTLWRANATDTGYLQWTLQGTYNFLFDLAVTKISGTVAGTAILQGSIDSKTWHTLTGIATYCADCSGASATVTNATAHYQWYLSRDATNYPYYQVRYISSDTSGHSSYTGTANWKN